MKHRNKFLAALVLGVLGLSACNFSIPSEFFSTPSSESPSSSETSSVLGSSSNSESSRNPEIEAIYNLYFKTATEAGITPLSYQEWLASLNGVVIDDTHVPVIGVNSDGYWTIDGVSTGVKATGNEGIHGKDNVTYYTGVNAPENNLGQVGDLYVNTTNWSYYAKGNNGWELKGSLLSGGSSQNTNTIRVASGEPDALLGQVGDVYINTDNWNFYVKSSNGWELKGNLQRELEVKWSVTIVPSEHGSITANVTSATAGTEVVFTIRPDNDYYLSDLEVNNVSVIASVAGNTYTTKMVENGLTVKGTFKTGQVQPHVHEYKTTYDYDTNGHWRECVAGDARTDEGPHEYNDWVIDVPATATTKGHQYRVCKVCSYKQEQDIEPTSHTHTSDKWSSNDTTHYHVCSGCGEMYDIAAHTFVQVTRVEPSNGQDGYLVEKCSVCSYEHRVTLPAAQQDIKIFATNDIHGQIYQETAVGDDGSAYVARNDIAKYMTFLKNQKAQGNTLLLDQGDTWQGSIYSNYNHGGLLTDLMNYVQFSARTVGNHDFDWGVEPIITNAHKNYNGYTTPTLAANVYDYNFATKTEGRNQQSQIGIPTITYNVSGVKVGVIGTIGSDQITSICTNNVKDICFKDHIQIIKQEAQRLRNEEKCDIVVLSHHGDQDDLTNQNLNQFINVALCAHSHQWEHCTEGELVYVQGRSNNRHVWQLNLPYSISSHTLGEIDYASISASYIDRNVTTVDTTIAKLVNDNYTACLAQEPLDEIIANNVSGFFGQGEELANLMADAIYEQAKSEGYDIYCSYVNNARHDINATSWTYADIFEAFPFENEVYIMNVSGKDFINEINNYNYVRKDMNLVLKYEDFSGSDRLMRTTLCPKYAKVPTGYVPTQVIVRDELNPGENTTQIISDLTFDTLPDRIFTKAYLEGLNQGIGDSKQ